jgi:RNA polymerase sigma-70 factor (ECF subfamily)
VGIYTEEHMSIVTLSGMNSLTEQLEQAFREHYQLVYRTAYGVTGSREDAQDILQTVFLRLLRREIVPDPDKNPKAFLYRAAVNLSLNTIRQRQRFVLVEGVEAFEKIAAAKERNPDRGLHDRLYAAMAELEPEVAEMLILRYVHDYSIAEIATLLDKSRSLIAVRLFRSRARLRERIRAPEKGKL